MSFAPTKVANLCGGSDAGGTSFVTGSVTLTSGNLYMMFVSSVIAAGTPAAPTISGWTNEGSRLNAFDSHSRITLFAKVGDGSTGTQTISFGGVSQDAILIDGGFFTGAVQAVDSTAFAQVVALDGINSSTPHVTLAAFGNVNNGVFFGCLDPSNRFGGAFTLTASPAFTDMGNYVTASYPACAEGLAANNTTTTVTTAFTSSSHWVAMAAEIVAAPTASLPTVTTSAATSVNATNAVGNGNVTSDGGATITERGCVWATTSNPTTSNNKVTAAGTTGSYTATMDIGTTGAVLPSTTYHYRAYAINSVGTSYGADTTFTTIAPQNFADSRCVIAKNMVSAQNEAESWNVAVLAALYANLGNIVRTSDHVVTVTLPAASAYSISAPETITDSTTTAITQGAHALTGVPTFIVNQNTGSVASITSLSRDIASAAGGCSITATCVAVVGTPPVTITVGITPYACTVTGTTGTTVTFTVPAIAGVTLPVYAVLKIGTQTFTNYNYLSGNFGVYGHPTTFPLEIGPAYSLVLGRTGFENNAIPSADGQLTASTTPTGGSSMAVVTSGTVAPHSGTYCLRQISGQTADNTVAYGGAWAQTDICSSSGGTGRWHRWWVQFTSATLTSVANNGQIKNFLSRTTGNNFGVVGTGPEFRDPAQDGINVMAVNNDNLNLHINDNSANPPVGAGSYGVEPTIIGDVWHEIMVWEYRDTAAGVGHLKAYWDGKKIADDQFSNPTTTYTGMGSDTTSDVRGAQVGLVYTQNCLSYPITEYIDDICIANGCIDPQDI